MARRAGRMEALKVGRKAARKEVQTVARKEVRKEVLKAARMVGRMEVLKVGRKAALMGLTLLALVLQLLPQNLEAHLEFLLLKFLLQTL